MNRPAALPIVRLLLATALLAGAGCASLLGGGDKSPTVYAPVARTQANAAWPAVPWQLVVATTSAAPIIDSQRIAVRPSPAELQVYKGANWARRPTDMLEDVLLRTLEESGKVRAVARAGSGINADYRLVLDLRRFESDYAGAAVPSATIEVNAKLLHAQDERVVASRTFLQSQPAAGTEVAQVDLRRARADAAAVRRVAEVAGVVEAAVQPAAGAGKALQDLGGGDEAGAVEVRAVDEDHRRVLFQRIAADARAGDDDLPLVLGRGGGGAFERLRRQGGLGERCGRRGGERASNRGAAD